MSPQDGGVARGIASAAVVGITLLGMARGGLDVGTIPGTVGAWGLLAAIVAAAALAFAACVVTRRVAWGRPAGLGAAALSGLVAWSALSIAWATAPDRAWLSTHRAAAALAVLVLAICLARVVRDPAHRFAAAVTGAASAVLVWSLATRVFPELLAPLDDDARLAAPIGHANAVGLLAVFAVPGALLLASERRWRGPSAALLGLAFVVLGLTGSRSALLAMVATLVLALWLLPGRAQMLTALGAAVAAAIPSVAYALLSDPLSSTPLPDPAERRWESLLLGAAVVAGLALAPSIGDLLAPTAARLARWTERPRAGGLLLAAGAFVIVAGGVLSALGGRSASSGAGRSLSLDSNNRDAWWGQAWRGFTDAPLNGHGAGSFVLTNIAERTDGRDSLRARQPHQVVLEFLTELGVVGLLLAVVGVGAVLWAARRVGRPGAPALCVVVAFLIQAQLDIPWSVPAIGLPAVAAGGVILAMAAPPARTPSGVAGLRVGAVGLFALGAIASAVAYGIGLDRVNDASRELTRGNPPAAISPARAATRINRLAIASLMIEAQARARTGDGPGAARAATRATERQPDNPFAWECLAEVTGGANRAAALARVAELDPRRDPAELPRCQPGW